MKTKILSMLRDCGGFVSGQQMCDEFGVSRTAVWKVMNQLKEEGYEIESVKNKGYRLINTPDILTKSEIQSKMRSQNIGSNVIYFNELDSTNTYAKKIAEDVQDGTLVVCNKQTAGKGSRGRSWNSPESEAIYMTVILKPQDLSPMNASMITLVAALAVRAGIGSITGLSAMIKWPNDIVLSGKKVCGILTEMSAELECINYIVCGIGINVNQQFIEKDIEDKATSIKIESGKKTLRSTLIAEVMYHFEKYYKIFLEDRNLSSLQEEYNNYLINSGREVRLREKQTEKIAIANGIDEYGQLIVTDEHGIESKISAGEVSVRGLYSYV